MLSGGQHRIFRDYVQKNSFKKLQRCGHPLHNISNSFPNRILARGTHSPRCHALFAILRQFLPKLIFSNIHLLRLRVGRRRKRGSAVSSLPFFLVSWTLKMIIKTQSLSRVIKALLLLSSQMIIKTVLKCRVQHQRRSEQIWKWSSERIVEQRKGRNKK